MPLMPSRCHPSEDVVQAVEPGDAVFVGERDAGVHLLAIGFAVVVVAFGEFPAGQRDERVGDGGLSGAGDSHDDDDHVCGVS